VNREQVRNLLKLIYSHDEREVTDLAIDAWQWHANNGNWDEQTARDAVHLFYEAPGNGPIEWRNGPVDGEPRPILPADINAFHALRRDVIQGER